MKNFEACPKRSWHCDILPKGDPNRVQEPEGPQLAWGNRVHAVMKDRCGVNRVAIPADFPAHYENWAQKVIGNGQNVFVEQSLTINRNFTPTGNFDPDAWLRVKCDLYRIAGDVCLAVDWKTGKILEDSVQLALTAVCLFALHPQLKAVRASYIWLAEDCESSETFMREDVPVIWRSIWPRVENMEQAHQHTNYPPTPSGICVKWCVVKSCPHNGKGSH